MSWLLDSLIEDIVVIVELDNKPRVNLPLGIRSLNFDGERYIVRPYEQQAF